MFKAKNPIDAHLNVILKSETPGDFEIEPHPPGSLPKGSKDELIFKNDGHPGFSLHFHLTDETGLGYRFPPQTNVKQAVWSKLGAGVCPDEPVWEVFEPQNVSHNGMMLTVRNPNQFPALGKFGYTLRVTKNGGKRFLPLDPGGDNRNGGIDGLDFNITAAFVGGALIGVVALIVGQALFRD